PEKYVLQAVLVHSGNVNAGHYFAYINTFDGFSADTFADLVLDGIEEDDYLEKASSWFKFNDEKVIKVSQKRAIESSFGGNLKWKGFEHMNREILNGKLERDDADEDIDSNLKKCTNAYMLV